LPARTSSHRCIAQR